MVKSVVKAMDALQAFARQEWKFELKQFIVAGGSKRGWTTWLTAACDGRVKALVPMVIDTLNMMKQMPHQLAAFGAYSDMIRDYTKRGLVPLPNTARARELWKMVDPWTYRKRIRQPKLIINGTNDPYWALDALNLYWDDLRGPKWLLYVPNAGHDLLQKDGARRDPTRVLSTLASFVRHETENRPMPKVEWKREKVGSRVRLTVKASPAPKAARWWVAEATTLDFRKSRWTAVPATLKGGTMLAVMGPPSSGCRAFFGELEYEVDGQTFYLSTQISIVGKPAR
jgi:PhoPQ-activated pathogenicity-related protein